MKIRIKYYEYIGDVGDYLYQKNVINSQDIIWINGELYWVRWL